MKRGTTATSGHNEDFRRYQPKGEGMEGSKSILKRVAAASFVAVMAASILIVVPGIADPTMIGPGYRVEIFATGLEKPSDLIFDASGSLLVSETAAERVSRIEVLPDGTAGEISTVASGIVDAEGLALDASGDFFVSDDDIVFKVANGTTTEFASEFNDAEGLAIDQSGDLFVADDNIGGGIRVSRIEVLPNGSVVY